MLLAFFKRKAAPIEKELSFFLFDVLKPSTTSLAYALFLACNAAIVWGGVFPFIPLELQTKQLTISFFFAQSTAFALTFCFALSYISFKQRARSALPFAICIAAITYFLGWISLVATLYLRTYAFFIIVAGGVLVGVGAACFLLLWTWTFSAMDKKTGALACIQGFLYCPIAYFVMNLIPQSIAVFLMPALFGPLSFFGMLYAIKKADFSLPHCASLPRKTPVKYKRAIKDCLSNILAIASFAFACGAIRSTAINDISVGLVVNNASMLGSFLGACFLIYLWSFKSIRFNMSVVFRVFYPIVMIGFFFLPLFTEFSDTFLIIYSGLLYALFMTIITLTIIQCIQISYARVIHPVFIFGIYCGMIYLVNDFGFLTGQFAEAFAFPHISTMGSLSLLVIFTTSMMFYIGNGGWKSAVSINPQKADYIDLISSGQVPDARNRPSAGDYAGDQIYARDRLDMQCRALGAHFGLSAREREIVELIVRGHTTKSIATVLRISENTVLTHRKRLYSKLDIHKKQELCDTVDAFSPQRAAADEVSESDVDSE